MESVVLMLNKLGTRSSSKWQTATIYSENLDRQFDKHQSRLKQNERRLLNLNYKQKLVKRTSTDCQLDLHCINVLFCQSVL